MEHHRSAVLALVRATVGDGPLTDMQKLDALLEAEDRLPVAFRLPELDRATTAEGVADAAVG